MSLRIRSRSLAALASLLLFAGFLAIAAPRSAVAANPPPVQTYFISVPAQQSLDILQEVNADSEEPVFSYTSIAIGASGTLIYYDHWENGYVADLSNPTPAETYANPGNLAGVQIWGDGDTTNGAPPGFPGDVLSAGDVIILSSDINLPRVASEIEFDGSDRFGTTRSVAVVHSQWADPSDVRTLLAFAHELYSTNRWGTDYTAPVGCDTPSSGSMFQYSALSIMAVLDNTTIEIDSNADGTYENTQTLDKGESYLEDGFSQTGCDFVRQGAKVRTTDPGKPIQVQQFIGDIEDDYEIRDITLVPDDDLSVDYYVPVGFTAGAGNGGTSGPLRVWLYNPNASTIYVRCERGGTTSVDSTIGVNGTAFVDIPSSAGANCYAMDSTFTSKVTNTPFSGLYTMDASSDTSDGNARIWDWSATLIPTSQLTNQVLVGLGLGRDPTSGTNPTQNGNPIWVTPTCQTYFYVDWNNDGTPDLADLNGDNDTTDVVDGISESTSNLGMLVPPLQSVRLFNPSTPDQTGARIYTRTAANNTGDGGCKFAAAWGEDPRIASAAAPGLDVGTTVLPVVSLEISKVDELLVDADGNGVASPGDTIEYVITITNVGLNTESDVYVYDEVPAFTTYVANTTEKDTTGNGGGPFVPIPDDGVGTAFPLDVTGGVLLGDLAPGDFFLVRFNVTLDAVTSPNNDYDLVTNCGVTLAENIELTACADTPVDTDPVIEVTKDANPTQVTEPGGSVVFTVKVENTGPIAVNIDTLNDDKFDDITDDVNGTNPKITTTTCTVPQFIDVGGSYQCTFTATVSGSGGTTHTNTVTASGKGVNDKPVSDDDPADVDITTATPEIEVTKDANPTQIMEPGGPVVFTVRIDNTGDGAVNITSLTDDKFGDITQVQGLVTATTCSVPQNIAEGDFYQCTFTATVNGAGGTTHTNTVTASGTGVGDKPVQDDDPADVEILTANPEIEVTKEANPTVVTEPGGPVVFTVRIDNTGDGAVNITSLTDDKFGDITQVQGLVTATDCTLPQNIAEGGFYQCTFTATVNGTAGNTHTNTVTASGTGVGDKPVQDDDPADVRIVAPEATAKIGDTIFYDLDGNGSQDAGETGIPGITVQLTPPPGVDLGNGPGNPITMVTDANGNYLFEGLPPGTYVVEVLNPPPGSVNTADPDGGGDSKSTVTLAEGEVNLDQDFGYQPPNACPAGSSGVTTSIFGKGMFPNQEVRVNIPNAAEATNLYAQLAGKKEPFNTYTSAVFRPLNGMTPLATLTIPGASVTSKEWRTWAVFWFGQDLSAYDGTATGVRGRLNVATSQPPPIPMGRALIVYADYPGKDIGGYWNYVLRLDKSIENHVYWGAGWIPSQTHVVDLDGPLPEARDIFIQAAVVDNDADTRPFYLTITALDTNGDPLGTPLFFNPTGPSLSGGPGNAQILNLLKGTLSAPVGTEAIEFKLESPRTIGESAALVGVAANYVCVLPTTEP